MIQEARKTVSYPRCIFRRSIRRRSDEIHEWRYLSSTLQKSSWFHEPKNEGNNSSEAKQSWKEMKEREREREREREGGRQESEYICISRAVTAASVPIGSSATPRQSFETAPPFATNCPMLIRSFSFPTLCTSHIRHTSIRLSGCHTRRNKLVKASKTSRSSTSQKGTDALLKSDFYFETTKKKKEEDTFWMIKFPPKVEFKVTLNYFLSPEINKTYETSILHLCSRVS